VHPVDLYAGRRAENVRLLVCGRYGAGCPGRCTGRVIVSLRVADHLITGCGASRNDLCLRPHDPMGRPVGSAQARLTSISPTARCGRTRISGGVAGEWSKRPPPMPIVGRVTVPRVGCLQPLPRSGQAGGAAVSPSVPRITFWEGGGAVFPPVAPTAA
jgi:hypothetical protein